MTEAVEKIRKEVGRNAIPEAFNLLENELRKANREEQLQLLYTLKADYSSINHKQKIGIVTPADETRRREIIYQILVLAGELPQIVAPVAETPTQPPITAPREQFSPDNLPEEVILISNQDIMKNTYEEFINKKAEWEEMSVKGNLLSALSEAVRFTKENISEFKEEYSAFGSLNGILNKGDDYRKVQHEFFERLGIMEKDIQEELKKLTPSLGDKNVGTLKTKKGCGVLILSNPSDTYLLRIHEEIVVIDQFFEVLKKRNSIQERTTLIGDTKVFRELDKYPPKYLHFIGHGNEEGDRILFQNEMGKQENYSSSELINYFKLSNLEVQIQLAFFNSCNSSNLAKKMAEFAEYTIGWENKVDDTVASEFAQSFYIILTNRLENEHQQSFSVSIEGAFNSAKAMFGFDLYSKNAKVHLFKR